MIVVAVAVVAVRMMFRARSRPVIVSVVAVAADIRFDGMLAGARFAHPFQFGDQCLRKDTISPLRVSDGRASATMAVATSSGVGNVA